MRTKLFILFFIATYPLALDAQEGKYLVQFGVGDFKAGTSNNGNQSLLGIANYLSLDISRRLPHHFYLDGSFGKWTVDPQFLRQSQNFQNINNVSDYDRTRTDYILYQYAAHFWGLGVSRRGNITKRLEYGAGLKVNYMTISNYIIDSFVAQRTSDGSYYAPRGHEEREGALGTELHGQLDYRLLRKTPVYIGAHGSYSMYAVLPRRISAAGIHLLFKFGEVEEEVDKDKL